MKTYILTSLILITSFSLLAQRNFPPDVLKAIPSKYKVAGQMFIKQGFMARGELNLEIPNKFGCNNGNLGVCNIKVTITAYDESQKDYLEMVEKRLPFQNRLPNASNYKPSVDPYNKLVTYGNTKEVKLEGGSAAYYLQKNSCIMDQHAEYESVSLKSLQGSTPKAVEINIYGGISADEAISIVKEIYGILKPVNYMAP